MQRCSRCILQPQPTGKRYSSSSSCHAISTDIPDPFSPSFYIVHCFRQVFNATSCIGTELLYVGSSWSSCICSSMWRGPQEYITYEFVLTSPAVSRMSGYSNFDSFRDGWQVAVQLLLCGLLPPGLFNIAAFFCRGRQAFIHAFS